MKTVVCQIMENSLIRGFPKFEPFCCVFSIICYKMKIGRIIQGGGVYLSKIIFHTFCHIDNTAAERYDSTVSNDVVNSVIAVAITYRG